MGLWLSVLLTVTPRQDYSRLAMDQLRNHLVELEEDLVEEVTPVEETFEQQATTDNIITINVNPVEIPDDVTSEQVEVEPHPYDGTILNQLWPTLQGRYLPAVVVHVNYYTLDDGGGEGGGQLIPCEIGLTAFSVQRGILDSYSTLLGADFPSASSTQLTQLDVHAVTRGINELPYSTGSRLSVHAIQKFLDKKQYIPRGLRRAPIFCSNSCITDVKKILEDLYAKNGLVFKNEVLSLEWLMVSLSQSGLLTLADMESVADKCIIDQITGSIVVNLQREKEGLMFTVEDLSAGCYFNTIDVERHLQLGTTSRIAARETVLFPEVVLGVFCSESRASAYLTLNKDAYGCLLACRYHDVNERVDSGSRSVFCALSISQRQVFLLLDAVAVNFGIAPRVSRHYPRGHV
ncbi:unnamed protein product [Orchesella dallaii]|uniref:Maelstrom domain-containing protein n=1 Tax=Orchesella dallaii TaxID=48710 RepID=A0ABP1RSB9_9HEXA